MDHNHDVPEIDQDESLPIEPADAGDISVADQREYAWLLVREGTLYGEIMGVWNAVPIGASFAGRLFGYPLRFALFVAFVLFVGALVMLLVISAVQIPVFVFVFVEGWLATWIWLLVLCPIALALAGYIAYAFGVTFQDASGATEATDEIADGESTNDRTWSRSRSLHLESERSRRFSIAVFLAMLAMTFQCIAVASGTALFDGPVEVRWQWPVFFAERLFSTALFGIPESLLAGVSEITPANRSGQLLVVAIDICYAAGVVAMFVMIFATEFKPRELFNGTTRDLADYLENCDITKGDKMTIHRVAVVRPLDRSEVISTTKQQFFDTVQAQQSRAASSD